MIKMLIDDQEFALVDGTWVCNGEPVQQLEGQGALTLLHRLASERQEQEARLQRVREALA